MAATKQSDADDVPPLEDMSEYIDSIESLKVKQEPAASKIPPTNTDSSLLNLENKNRTRPGLIMSGGGRVNNVTPETKKSDSKKPPAQQKMQSKSDFGGMKKGFLSGDSRGKAKAQGSADAKAQAVPLLTAQPKGDSLKFDEVQEEMKKSYPLLAGKDWITDDLLSKIEQNPILAKSFADPSLSRVLEDFHRNPQDTLARAKESPEMEQFLREFCALMGSHFTSLADKEEREEEVKSKQPQQFISKHESEAEQVPTSSTTLNKIDQHLTCPVCLSQYHNPKTLPCLHSFCLACIKQMRFNLHKGKYCLSCPSCHKLCEVPDSGPAHLPTAFFINNLLDVQQVLKKVSDSHKISCDHCESSCATSYCKQYAKKVCADCLKAHNSWIGDKHQIIDITDVATIVSQLLPAKQEQSMNCTDHNEPLKVFCNTCQELICRDCTVRHHKDHNYDLINDTFPQHHKQIESVLQLVKEKVVAANEALMALTTKEREVTTQVHQTIQGIRTQARAIVELVQQTENQLVGEAGNMLQHKMQLLGKQKQEVETGLAQLKRLHEYIEQCLEVSSQQQILLEKRNLIQHVEAVNAEIDPHIFQPVEEANVTFTGNEMQAEKCKELGKLEYFCFSKNHIDVSLPEQSLGIVGRECSIGLRICSNTGSPFQIPPSVPLTCHLIPPDKSSIIVCDIKEIEIGKYRVSFTPSTAGKHQVKIQAAGIVAVDVPISLNVCRAGKPLKVIAGVKWPRGIAINKDGVIAVAECESHCITILDKEGRKVRSFESLGKGRGQFSYPRGVAFTNDGHIVVTDSHRLSKVTLEGHHIMSVGGGDSGTGPLQFSYPKGIAVHPTTQQIYVTDHRNHRIQVINEDFSFSHFIGSKGTAPGQLKYPWDIAVDGIGQIYVANGGNYCIDVFTSDGKYVTQFGSKGSGEGQLKFPSFIAIDTHDIVYVTEHKNNRISVFNTDGEFIQHIGNRGSGEVEFYGPYGITVDMLGTLYVSDTYNNRIVVL